jgi:cytochrome c-type biogenesis protein CcmE
MNKMRIKLIVGTCVFIGAIAYLAVAGARQSLVYHLTVDQFLADSQHHAQRVRLFGNVDSQNFASDPGNLTASFTLKGTAATIPVQYHGVIPGLFQAHRDVVIEGQLNEQGVFVADVMMTKCASKYESKTQTPADAVQAAAATAKPGSAS